MWGTALAPTVVHARGVAPRRLVTRPFHGLRLQQETPLRALDLATPAVAVDAQQAISVRARALVQHGARCRIKRGWRAVVLAVLAARSAVLAKVPGRVGASGTVDGRSYVHAEGSRVTLQDRV